MDPKEAEIMGSLGDSCAQAGGEKTAEAEAARQVRLWPENSASESVVLAFVWGTCLHAVQLIRCNAMQCRQLPYSQLRECVDDALLSLES